MDDETKEALLSRFRTYLDTAEDEAEPADDPDSDETTDLYSVFVEMAGLRTEVRTEFAHCEGSAGPVPRGF